MKAYVDTNLRSLLDCNYCSLEIVANIVFGISNVVFGIWPFHSLFLFFFFMPYCTRIENGPIDIESNLIWYLVGVIRSATKSVRKALTSVHIKYTILDAIKRFRPSDNASTHFHPLHLQCQKKRYKASLFVKILFHFQGP